MDLASRTIPANVSLYCWTLTFAEQSFLQPEHSLLASLNADDRVIAGHGRSRMASLHLGLERRGTLLLNPGQILATERVPAEPCGGNLIMSSFFRENG